MTPYTSGIFLDALWRRVCSLYAECSKTLQCSPSSIPLQSTCSNMSPQRKRLLISETESFVDDSGHQSCHSRCSIDGSCRSPTRSSDDGRSGGVSGALLSCCERNSSTIVDRLTSNSSAKQSKSDKSCRRQQSQSSTRRRRCRCYSSLQLVLLVLSLSVCVLVTDSALNCSGDISCVSLPSCNVSMPSGNCSTSANFSTYMSCGTNDTLQWCNGVCSTDSCSAQCDCQCPDGFTAFVTANCSYVIDNCGNVTSCLSYTSVSSYTSAISVTATSAPTVTAATTVSATVCDSNPCRNNGTCFAVNDTDYLCNCTEAYTGVNCTQPAVIDQCLISPCLHNGTCYSTQTGYNCSCVPGYGGLNCSDISCDGSLCPSSAEPFVNLNVTSAPVITSSPNVAVTSATASSTTTSDDVIGTTSAVEPPPTTAGVNAPSTGLTSSEIGLIVGLIVGVFVAALLIIGIVVLVKFAKNRRALAGTYHPSKQETAGARWEFGNALKEPPEERLI